MKQEAPASPEGESVPERGGTPFEIRQNLHQAIQIACNATLHDICVAYLSGQLTADNLLEIIVSATKLDQLANVELKKL